MLSGAVTFLGCTRPGSAQVGTSAVFSGATAAPAAADAPSSTSCSPGAAAMAAAPRSAVQGAGDKGYRPAERQLCTVPTQWAFRAKLLSSLDLRSVPCPLAPRASSEVWVRRWSSCCVTLHAAPGDSCLSSLWGCSELRFGRAGYASLQVPVLWPYFNPLTVPSSSSNLWTQPWLSPSHCSCD